MARSEEKTDLFGNKYIQHYDDEGNEIGRSEPKTGLFGDEYVEHRDQRGDTTGRSEPKSGLFGDEFVEHRDERGDVTGRSEPKTGLFGDEFVEHRDERGDVTGRSEPKTGLFGDEFVQHYNERGDKSGALLPGWLDRRLIGRRPINDPLDIVWGVLALVAAITLLVVFAIWKYRWVRFAFFIYMALGLQVGVFGSVASGIEGHFLAATAGAVAAAAVSVPLYRFCFSALRWRAEPQARANAWQVSGVLAAISLVGFFALGLQQPAFTPRAQSIAAQPQPMYQAPNAIAPPADAVAPPADAPPLIVRGAVGQSIPVRDFRSDPDVTRDASGAGYVLAPTSADSAAPYTITYNDSEQRFLVVLNSEPYSQTRGDAERFLQVKLGVQWNDLCSLNYNVSIAPREGIVDPHASQNLMFSFCDGAVQALNSSGAPAEALSPGAAVSGVGMELGSPETRDGASPIPTPDAAFLAGGWQGSVTEGARTYHVVVRFDLDGKGVPIGNVHYVGLSCTGAWIPMDLSPGRRTWVFEEMITPGAHSCVTRTRVGLAPQTDGTLTYASGHTTAVLRRVR